MTAARQQRTSNLIQSVSVDDKIYRKKQTSRIESEVGVGLQPGKSSLTFKQRLEEVKGEPQCYLGGRTCQEVKYPVGRTSGLSDDRKLAGAGAGRQPVREGAE